MKIFITTILIFIVASLAVAQSSLDSGLVAFYPFSESANDESGNDLHLINSGATLTTDRFGVSNGAYYFSGSSNLSRIDNDLLDLMSDFSVSFWINRPGSIEYTFVMSKHLSGDDFSGSWGIASYAGGNTITFAGTPNWGSGSNPITGVVSENEWHHITFTYDKSTSGWKSFLDGILSNSGIQTFNIQNTDKDFMIGACMPNVSNITASLDDIRIYNRVIDSSEVLALYNDSTSYLPPIEDGLVAYWTFDGNTIDSTLNNNNGVNYGGTFNYDRYGVPDRSIYFDGLASYVEGINSGNNLPVGDSPRTFSCWVKSSYASSSRNIFHYGTAQVAPTNYHLFMQDGKYVGIGNGYGYGILISNKDIGDETWHFITTVYEGSTSNLQHIFIDGKFDTSAVILSTPNTVLTNNWKMGQFMGGSASLLGYVDDLKIFNLALSGQEINNLYKASTTAPNLLFPGNDSTINSLTPAFDWDSTVTANYYEIRVFSDSSLTMQVLDENSYSSSYQVSSGLLQPNTHYYWKIRTINDGGLGPWSEVFNFDIIITDVEDEQQLPKQFALMQNYPNPFNPSTTISYHLPKASNVKLKVYDIIGNEVATLVNEEKAAGIYNVQAKLNNLSSGIYFYTFTAGDFVQTRKMILIK